MESASHRAQGAVEQGKDRWAEGAFKAQRYLGHPNPTSTWSSDTRVSDV